MSKHDEDFMVMLRREIHRYFSEIYLPHRTGLVTSYNPQNHTAKVMLQPEGKETEFIPIHMHHVGANFGVLVGLTPGDGIKTGDQVEVAFQEGDREAGRIIARVPSAIAPPPVVQSGEILVKHKKQGNLYFKQDGSVTHTDGNGATLFHDGQGNATHTAKTIKHNASAAGATINDTATDTNSNRTNTRVNDPANKQIVDTATDGSKQATVIAHADNGAAITATDGTNVATVNAMPNGVVQIIASQGVSMAAGALGMGSAGGGTSALAASNGTTTPGAGAIGQPVTSGLITGVSLSNGVSKTVCSIALTPGQWDIWGTLYFLSLGGTTNYVLGGLATVLNTYPNNLTGIPYPDMYVENDYVYGDYVASVGRTTLIISANTTFYLNVNVGWASGSPQGGGILSAVRSG